MMVSRPDVADQMLLAAICSARGVEVCCARSATAGPRRPRHRGHTVGGPSRLSDGGCAASASQARWLSRRGVDRAGAVHRELLVRPAPQRTTLAHAVNLLVGAALRYRDRFGAAVPLWALIGSFVHGRLLAPAHLRRS